LDTNFLSRENSSENNNNVLESFTVFSPEKNALSFLQLVCVNKLLRFVSNGRKTESLSASQERKTGSG